MTTKSRLTNLEALVRDLTRGAYPMRVTVTNGRAGCLNVSVTFVQYVEDTNANEQS